MKQIISILSISAIALMALSSCQKENEMLQEKPSAKTAIMTVNAGSTTTKTAINEVDSKNYTLTWTAGDAIACYEVGVVESVPTIQGKTTSTALDADAANATFTINLSGNAADPNYSYIFVYPAAKYTKNTGANPIYRGQIPENQTFSATSFDKDADLLISRAIIDQAERPTSVNAEFERIGATALMNIKAPTTTEKIRSITFSTTEGNLYGYVKVYPLDGTHDTDIYSGGHSLTLTPASSTTYSGTIPVWFRLGEITLSDNFTVVVTTNQKIYSKTVNLASASRTLEFHNAGLTKFNVNMESVAGVDNPSLDDGDYYIVAKYSGNYYAMSSSANGTRLTSVQLDDFDPDATSYVGSDASLEWTITNDGDAITVQDGSDKYLSLGNSNGTANTGSTKKTYTLATGSASGTMLLNSVNNSGYGLRYNSGNAWFALYDSAVSATMIGDIYFMPKDPRTRVTPPTNVDASVSGTTLTIIWDDASDVNIDHYLVTLSGAADDTQVVAIGEEGYEFTGLSDGTYSVSVEAVPSNTTVYLNSLPETVSNLIIGSSVTYTKCTGSLTSGWYVIGNVESTTVHAINNTVGTSWIRYTDVTASAGGVITNPSDAVVWYYDASTGTIKNKDNTNYIYWSSGNVGCCGPTSYTHTVTESETAGVYNIKSKATSTRVLRRNGTSGYRYYTTNTGTQEICFFKLD